MDTGRIWFCVILFVLNLTLSIGQSRRTRGPDPCYTADRRPQRCFPPFVNAAFNVPVEATNTCGFMGAEDFCQQTGAAGATKSCDVCDPYDPQKSHPPRYLTDFHSVDNLTWWQSSTMLEDVQWPTSVNLTINLGKAFEITYVRLKFFSSRPESFAIYKRQSEDSEWTPFQFYSGSCEDTYNMTSRPVITYENEGEAVCKDEFSDISPLTGGSVAFSTLEGRPRAYEFERTPVLQEWVTATDIRIVLNRLNTFRDEVFGDPNVLRSYFYAISDFAIGGRCKCNGHAGECVRSSTRVGKLVCLCEHNTDGPECDRCLPFYNDIPWKRSITGQVVECRACNCHGRSESCYFDEALYNHTGHGGHCTDCTGYTDGPNCERCQEGFFRLSDTADCSPCYCHPRGSLSPQCDIYGRCYCKPGVTGEKCDYCENEFYNLTEAGCSPCECLVAGSIYNRPRCDSYSGRCDCKERVEGQRCDTCRAGYFNLQEDDPFGCMTCFCYGHSKECSLSQAYSLHAIKSPFTEDVEGWTGKTRGEDDVELGFRPTEISITSADTDFAYFVFPSSYLGDKRFSYNQVLAFTLRFIGEDPRASVADLVIEGNGLMVMAPIFAQGNQMPSPLPQEYGFRLSEHVSYRWTPQLTSQEFVRMLSNITSIKLRGIYSLQGGGYLSDVTLLSAKERSSSEELAASVEQCACPDGYVGQFCESCAPGYRRDTPNGGPYAACVSCGCHGHSDDCDIDTGRCICDHNTTGEHCERCLDGFYGDATTGTPDDCTQCPCPDGALCVKLLDNDVACFNCPPNQTGRRCEFCSNGYYGDPTGLHGDPQACRTCECNNNIDPNAVGNCNVTTGECLRCIYNTAGDQCERCLPGYYGNALLLPHGDCQACECFPLGTSSNGNSWDSDGETIISCDKVTGICPCLPNVVGQHCDECLEGYWNIVSGSGCETCNCDRMGSVNGSCDVASGQCFCKDGVSGLKCDQCLPNYFGFSPDGCTNCNCDPDGSVSLQCEIATGLCSCRPNVIGRHCDACDINKHNISAGCIDCPVCYNIVMEAVNITHAKITELKQIINSILHAPSDAFNDTEFLEKLSAVNSSVYELWNDAQNTNDAELVDGYTATLSAIKDLMNLTEGIGKKIDKAQRVIHNANVDTLEAQRVLNDTEAELTKAETYLKEEGLSTLEKAIEQQQRLGQQSNNMTEMAQEARSIAERLESDADAVVERANEALETSDKALNLTEQLISKHTDVVDELHHLEMRVDGIVKLYDETKELADQTHNLTSDTYDQSLVAYTDADSLRIPDADADIKEEIGRINQTAVDLIQEVNEVVRQQDEQSETLAILKSNASQALADGQVQREALEGLLTDAESARTMAVDALKKADGILNEANETLTRLRGFDEVVQKSRIDAETAMEKVSQIQEYVADARNLTGNAIETLGNAESDATAAHLISENALNLTRTVLQSLVSIKEESSTIYATLINVDVETTELLSNVTELEERLRQLEIQAENDSLVIAETLQKAGEAKNVAGESSRKVASTLSEVNQMSVDIDKQPSFDIFFLAILEKYLESAEMQLAEKNIDVQFDALVQFESQMTDWLESYNEQLTGLSSDVENIKQINETIPRDCFRKINIEVAET